MVRHIVILSLVLVASIAGVQRATSQEDVERILTRAQTLYYEAKFKDSIDLLLPLDASLRQQPARDKLSINVKLQLALGYIGQNLTDEAKSVFQEVCLLDPEYALDSSLYAPKVLALFDEAKALQKKKRCDVLCAEIDRRTKNNDVPGLMALTKEISPGCVCGAASVAAEVLYRQGVEAYKRENFGEALDRFRGALKFRPEHDLAVQYAELADNKMKLTTERLVFDWHRYFEARDFPQAKAAYRQLELANTDGKSSAALEQMRTEYRKVLGPKVELWNLSCSTRTPDGLDALRRQATEILPDPAITTDLFARLAPCVPEPPPVSPVANVGPSVAPSPAPSTLPPLQGCIQMDSQLAIARIKDRTNPDIPPNRLPTGVVELRVKVRIDENGNVTVTGVEGSNAYINSAMKDAVSRWKFLPAIYQDQRRCVEAELPIRLSH